MFGDSNRLQDPYGDTMYSAEQIATTVFNDIEKPLTREEVIKEASRGWHEYCPNLQDYRVGSNYDYDWEAFRAAQEEGGERFAQELLKDAENKVYLLFEYCDNDGNYFATLEHGDIFSRLPHIKISKH